MLSEFIDKLLSLGEIRTKEIEGYTYSKEKLHRINLPKFESPREQIFHTLSGLIGFIEARSEELGTDLYLHIINHSEVSLKSGLFEDAGNIRFEYASASCIEKSFECNRYYPLEEFIISMQSQFIENPELTNLIHVLGNLANENVTENKDDGFSQSIHIRTGITTKSKVTIENPLRLSPYRTFREVDQPEGNFIFRLQKIRDGLNCALFESDGGAWKLNAIESIKRHLVLKLPWINVFG